MVPSFTEGLQGIQVIKGLGRARGPSPLRRAQPQVREQQQETFRTVSVLSPTIDLLGRINLVILLGMGGLLVLPRDRMTLGQLVVFAGILWQFSGQIASMATIVNTAQQSLIGAKRVFEVLDTPVEITTPRRRRSLPGWRAPRVRAPSRSGTIRSGPSSTTSTSTSRRAVRRR